MGESTPHVTAAELKVLKVLWRLESGTVRDVKDALSAEPEEDPAYTTVMTLMNQLANKGALNVEKSRQPFVYKPAVRREPTCRRQKSTGFALGKKDHHTNTQPVRLAPGLAGGAKYSQHC